MKSEQQKREAYRRMNTDRTRTIYNIALSLAVIAFAIALWRVMGG